MRAYLSCIVALSTEGQLDTFVEGTTTLDGADIVDAQALATIVVLTRNDHVELMAGNVSSDQLNLQLLCS